MQGALLSLDVESGDVLSLVGGYDFADSEFDRAVQAERQPGSAFKPFVYATALGRGYTPASILHDRPVVMEDGSGKTWRPAELLAQVPRPDHDARGARALGEQRDDPPDDATSASST